MLATSVVSIAGALLGSPAAPAGPSLAPQFHGAADVRTILSFGGAWLDDDFEPADEPSVAGIGLDLREPEAMLGFEAGYRYAWDDVTETIAGAGDLKVETTIHELYLGACWSYPPWFGSLRPYAGVGGSALYASYDVSGLGGSSSESGWAFGLYGHTGLEWDLGGSWRIGVDARGLLSTPAGLQEDVPLDYLQVALTVGWVW